MPDSNDQCGFREAAILHVSYMLSNDVKEFSKFHSHLSAFSDPKAIPPI
jgi:hypothetical protein